MFRNIPRIVLAADAGVQCQRPARPYLLGVDEQMVDSEFDRRFGRGREGRRFSKPFRRFQHRVERTRIDAIARIRPVLPRCTLDNELGWSGS